MGKRKNELKQLKKDVAGLAENSGAEARETLTRLLELTEELASEVKKQKKALKKLAGLEERVEKLEDHFGDFVRAMEDAVSDLDDGDYDEEEDEDVPLTVTFTCPHCRKDIELHLNDPALEEEDYLCPHCGKPLFDGADGDDGDEEDIDED